ncbi:MAG TPA: type II secretion system protein [Planctomycetota bacterium]|nr:type II secretion system protein [Planctomycetota bacterium]
MGPTVTRQHGFTLVEVMVALVIVTGSMVSLLSVVGNATDDVIRTVRQRKLRYLMQLQLGDIETRASMESSEESEGLVYEEGMRGDFRDFASRDQPNEYDQYEWRIPVFRDEIVAGATGDDEELLEAGFVEDSQGRITGRPVTRDAYLEVEGGEEEVGPPPGQVKRVLIFSVRFVGESVDDDLEYAIMTYLPYPGEEEQQQAVEGGEGTGPGGLGGASEPATGGRGSGSGGSSDIPGGRR